MEHGTRQVRPMGQGNGAHGTHGTGRGAMEQWNSRAVACVAGAPGGTMYHRFRFHDRFGYFDRIEFRPAACRVDGVAHGPFASRARGIGIPTGDDEDGQFLGEVRFDLILNVPHLSLTCSKMFKIEGRCAGAGSTSHGGPGPHQQPRERNSTRR